MRRFSDAEENRFYISGSILFSRDQGGGKGDMFRAQTVRILKREMVSLNRQRKQALSKARQYFE